MRKIKLKIFSLVFILLVAAGFLVLKFRNLEPKGEIVKEITPAIGSIRNIISTTGTVLPKNRLEVKPPVGGRVENILVKEGDKVKTGSTLAWMSSTERAALLDAARGQGEETLKYWQEIYKPIPLISPIDAQVIVATTQPGQTVTTNDAVIVLSDQLIVKAQVDETDIGKIKLGQNATIALDAYPDTKIKAAVDHIYYESQTVNNVTIYPVDLLPENVPEILRSGMNATVDFIVESKENILVIPLEAVDKEKQENFVYLKKNGAKEPVRAAVKLGISDDKNIEVISGITQNDLIIVKTNKYALPKSTTGNNPFMPRH